MAESNLNTDTEDPENAILEECLSFIEVAYASATGDLAGFELQKLKQQFLQTYKEKRGEVFKQEEESQLLIRDEFLDKLEESKIQTTKLRKKFPLQYTKLFEERISSEKELLLSTKFDANDSEIKSIQDLSILKEISFKSASKLASRIREVKPELESVLSTINIIDVAITMLKEDNEKVNVAITNVFNT